MSRFVCFCGLLFVNVLIAALANCYVLDSSMSSDRRMHPSFNFKSPHDRSKRAMPPLRFDASKPEETSTHYWQSIGQSILAQQITRKSQLNTQLARNVIFFLGDGMSIPTLTAGRVYLGGEEQQFSFEQFPYVGLSKTYCANTQVADSACSVTAYLGGVKANYGTIGVSAAIETNDCFGQNNTIHHVHSIAEWAQRAGMATGLITTTAVTHASPAGIYAHVANRNWENDAEVLADGGTLELCPDIATQLIEGAVGERLNVILGGGRTHFLPQSERDVGGESGKRLDGRNLIEAWKLKHGDKAHYVQNRSELLQLPPSAERILGLFAANHLPYHLDADPLEIPTLAEMVDIALNVLQRQSSSKGYLLFVEGGRIDHAHHNALAMKALDETAEFDKAVQRALARSSFNDTLTIVTADHAHTMSLAGYSSRKNDIFGINNGQLAADQLPYATLSYANGPGSEQNLLRKNLKQINMKHKEYQFPAAVPLESETHGGDDVGVFAAGPFAHLLSGVYEQNFIPHAVGYAACLSSEKGMRQRTACTDGLVREGR